MCNVDLQSPPYKFLFLFLFSIYKFFVSSLHFLHESEVREKETINTHKLIQMKMKKKNQQQQYKGKTKRKNFNIGTQRK